MIPFTDVRALLESLHPLRRVHNGDEFETGLGIVTEWMRAHGFRGELRIVGFDAGREINYWRIPRRWAVRRFNVRHEGGREIAGMASHPLTLMPFSDAFAGRLTKKELLARVQSREDLPDAIPFLFRKMYRHWETGWGLALPRRVVDTLPDGDYDVVIETEWRDEPLVMLEYTVAGEARDTVHLASHLDHPGQCNDGLSGVAAALCALREIEAAFPATSYTYSVFIGPEIVGSAAYLADHPELAARMRFCLCPNVVGHAAPVALCTSKRGDSLLDRALRLAALTLGVDHVAGLWHAYPDCGDEISYDAPGLGIPTSTVSRIGERFREYHTSLDTPDVVGGPQFEEAVALMTEALRYLELNAWPRRRFVGNPCLSNPELALYLEPTNLSNQLNPAVDRAFRRVDDGRIIDARNFQEFFLTNLDGRASLLDLAWEAMMPFDLVRGYAARFAEKGLVALEPCRERNRAGEVIRLALVRSGGLALVEDAGGR